MTESQARELRLGDRVTREDRRTPGEVVSADEFCLCVDWGRGSPEAYGYWRAARLTKVEPHTAPGSTNAD